MSFCKRSGNLHCRKRLAVCHVMRAYVHLLDTGVSRSVLIIAAVQFRGGLAMHTGIWAVPGGRPLSLRLWAGSCWTMLFFPRIN